MAKENETSGKETVIVVGFNARPIVSSAKRAGFKVLAVDYWGDTDLVATADDTETVLKQVPGKRPREELRRPASDLLFDCVERIASRHRGEADFILVGSGLDDRPDLWLELESTAPILGNPPATLARVRDRFQLYETASRLGIATPTTFKASSLKETLDFANKIRYPVVVKPPGGGGGLGIRFAKTESELRKLYLTEMKPHFGDTVFLQEYIEGDHTSASIMGNGSSCVVLTANEQLIGLGELGASAPFVWCGNVVPLDRSPNNRKVRAITAAAKSLGENLKLYGSNGFDFVLRRRDETPVIIECNPRFQGTLECVEMATGITLVNEHVKACRGELPRKLPAPERYVAKMIPFAKERCMVGDLKSIQGVGDVSPEGVICERGDPICTVHGTGETRDESMKNARKSVAEIYRRTTVQGILENSEE
ncbi:MAG: ATP-grasp domain-containing protein [Promethearchaeati archaeon SRVP18_Atabeyarchaeia-1]